MRCNAVQIVVQNAVQDNAVQNAAQNAVQDNAVQCGAECWCHPRALPPPVFI
jgi:hypothetical protein